MHDISKLQRWSARLAGSLLIGALIGCGTGGGGSNDSGPASEQEIAGESLDTSLVPGESPSVALEPSAETAESFPVIVESLPVSDPSPEMADQPTSTALADNTVVNGYGFEQFTTHHLRLDIASYSSFVSGDYVVAKLTDDENNTYYLGIPVPGDELVLSLSLPQYITRLWFELYTNDPSDTGLVEEITL